MMGPLPTLFSLVTLAILGAVLGSGMTALSWRLARRVAMSLGCQWSAGSTQLAAS